MPNFGEYNLREVYEKLPLLSKTVILSLGIQLIKEIETVHAAGYVHNDIKLDNFIVSAKGEVRLVDFGFAIKYYTSTKGSDCEVIHTHIGPGDVEY